MKKLTLMLAGMLLTLPVHAAEMGTTGATEATDTTMAKPATESMAEQKPQGEVARATFTTAVNDREPIDSIKSMANDKNKIYYFTELRNMTGKTIKHRWEYNGKVMAEIPFSIGGPRWRTFSSKILNPIWQGEWKVSVIDESGNTLSVNTFTYNQAPAQPAAASSEAGGESTEGESKPSN